MGGGKLMLETKERKFNRKMGLNLLLISAVFYFLPDFIMIDLLPDIIGYALAAVGLTMLADICEDLAFSRKRFMQLIIVGAARLFALFANFALFDNDERPTAILTMVFVLGVVECILLIPAVLSLSEGLLYLGTRHDGTAVFKNERKKRSRERGKSYTEAIAKQTVFFIIFKNALSILPETLSLAIGENYQSYTYQRYEQVNVLRVFSMILIGIAGIVWLIRVVSYLRAVMKDKPFMERIAEKYRVEILPNESMFFGRRVALAFLIMTVGVFAAMDFYIDGNDGMNIIPDIISAACLLVGVLLISKKDNKWRSFAIYTSAVYGIVSTLTWKFNYDFTYAYTAKDVSLDMRANQMWKVLIAAAVLEAACFVAMVIFTGLVLHKTIDDHTGYVSQHSTIDPVGRARQLHKTLRMWLRVATVIAAVAGVAGILRVWMFCSESFIADISWIIEMVLTGVFAGVFAVALSKIKEAIEEKNMLS